MKKLEVSFYLNQDETTSDFVISCKNFPLEFFAEIENSIDNYLPELQTALPTDEGYRCKLKPIYENDGSGAMRFDHFEICSIVCRTKYL